MEDINVQILDMDTLIPEQLVKNPDNSYTIFINARLSREAQLKAYQHALNHIKNEDFEKYDVQDIEFQAHDLEKSKESPPIPALKYEKRIKQLRRERKKLQQALKDKEREIDFIIELNGPDCFAKAAEYNWLYGGME